MSWSPRSRSAAVLALALVALAHLACYGGAPEAPPDPRIAQVESGLLPAVPIAGEPGWTLAERMAQFEVPGVSVAVWQDFEIAWTKVYGVADRDTGEPVTPETLFQAGSISKPVAAAAALALADRGRLGLDAPINDLLASWKLPDNELTADNPVTVRRLLSHTAGTTVHGFPGYAADAQVPTLVQVLDGAPPANTAPIRVDIPPGSQFRYSGGGTTVVQLALMDLEGQPFPALARRLVLDPLGMAHSTYEQPLPPERLRQAAAGHRSSGQVVPGKRHVYPEMAAAGLWTTAADLARFGIGIQRSLRGEPGALLARETAELMVTPVLGGAALGLFVDDKEGAVYFQHGGADEGFQAMLMAHREGGYGAAVMANSDNGIALANEILRGIAVAHGWQSYTPEPVTPLALTSEQLDAFTGRFQVADDRLFTITREGDHLLGRATFQQGRSRLIPVAEDVILVQDSGFPALLLRDEQGRPAGYRHRDGDDRGLRLRLPDGALEPVELLEAGRTAEALARYREIMPSESRLNNLGYGLLNNGRTDQALAVFRLNCDLYPGSANALDSLAEGHLAAGDQGAAAAAFRQVLEVLPRDTERPAAARQALETRARTWLAQNAG